MSGPSTTRLAEITLGLGARDGYSGDDLTNLRTACAHNEVPYLAEADTSDRVLELRIHGVGGAPAPDNLETPSTLQVAGDQEAGFYRAWYPGGSATGRPRVEAYCWGRLNYGAWWSALWLMLLPFGLINVAHWALPDAGMSTIARCSRAALRVLALVLTATFVATTVYLLADLVAWQAAPGSHLWSWLDPYKRWSIGARLAVAMLAALLVVGGLWWLSLRTQGRYEARQSGHGAPDDPDWPLSKASFWCGERPLIRQRFAHLTISGAVVLAVQMFPHSSLNGLRIFLLGLAIAFGAFAVFIASMPWTDRVKSAGDKPGWRDIVARVVAYLSLALAATVAVVRIGWQPKVDDAAIPYDAAFQVVLLVTCIGLCLLVFLVVAAQRPWGTKAEPRDVMGKGFTAFALTLLATLVAVIFGATLTMTVANLLGTPTAKKPKFNPLFIGYLDLTVPTTTYACGLAFAVTLISVVVVGVVLLVKRAAIAHHLRSCNGTGTLSAIYAGRGASKDGSDREARTATAKTWATSKLTDYAAGILLGISLPTALTLLTYESFLMADRHSDFFNRLATYGTSAGVFITGLFLVYLRSALTNALKRKRFGFFWDVVTFWPRACHPLGPPSYGERSVPEVVTRIRRIVGDVASPSGDPAVAQQEAEAFDGQALPSYREQHSPVLLVGYSQGSPIATAVVAQLPPSARADVALLTLAAPVRRLYGRAFFAYFGTDQLRRVESSLTTGGLVRWRNAVRRSDYIGGWALQEPPSVPPAVVDHDIYDPPVLWTNANPAPPPMHLHSDWFPDPQTRPFADCLKNML